MPQYAYDVTGIDLIELLIRLYNSTPRLCSSQAADLSVPEACVLLKKKISRREELKQEIAERVQRVQTLQEKIQDAEVKQQSLTNLATEVRQLETALTNRLVPTYLEIFSREIKDLSAELQNKLSDPAANGAAYALLQQQITEYLAGLRVVGDPPPQLSELEQQIKKFREELKMVANELKEIQAILVKHVFLAEYTENGVYIPSINDVSVNIVFYKHEEKLLLVDVSENQQNLERFKAVVKEFGGVNKQEIIDPACVLGRLQQKLARVQQILLVTNPRETFMHIPLAMRAIENLQQKFSLGYYSSLFISEPWQAHTKNLPANFRSMIESVITSPLDELMERLEADDGYLYQKFLTKRYNPDDHPSYFDGFEEELGAYSSQLAASPSQPKQNSPTDDSDEYESDDEQKVTSVVTTTTSRLVLFQRPKSVAQNISKEQQLEALDALSNLFKGVTHETAFLKEQRYREVYLSKPFVHFFGQLIAKIMQDDSGVEGFLRLLQTNLSEAFTRLAEPDVDVKSVSLLKF